VKAELEILPAQREFLEAKEFAPLFLSGYGAGKSYGLALKIIKAAFDNPETNALLIAPTYRMIYDVNLPLIEGLLQTIGIPYDLQKSNQRLYLPWSKTTIHFRSADYVTPALGLTVSFAAIDELTLMPEEAFTIAVSRARAPKANYKQVFSAATPEGFNWTYEAFEEEEREGYRIIRSSTYDNIFLDKRYSQELERALPKREREQKLLGRFADTTSGAVYSEFTERAVSDTSPFCKPNEALYDNISPNLKLCLALDFNVFSGSWLLFQHKHDSFYFCDEITLERSDTFSMIAALERLPAIQDIDRSMTVVYGDATGAARASSAARSDYELLRQRGFNVHDVPKANPPVKDRVLAVNSALAHGRLKISPKCKALLRDMRRLRWKPDGSGIDKRDAERSHASDALGYAVHRIAPVRKPVKPARIADIIKH